VKLPRSISGQDLVRALRVLGYQVTRQRGSHIRVTTQLDGQNHETVPNHNPIKPGLLHSVLKRIAEHHKLTMEQLLAKLDL
jgi:predicted RNA binding protein YcfA (HicA-like mRNA interferase family)